MKITDPKDKDLEVACLKMPLAIFLPLLLFSAILRAGSFLKLMTTNA